MKQSFNSKYEYTPKEGSWDSAINLGQDLVFEIETFRSGNCYYTIKDTDGNLMITRDYYSPLISKIING